MKIILLVVASALVSAQPKPNPSQQATNCAQNFAGSNNSGTVTCYGVDRRLAGQIGQLVSASKRDGKTLKDIADRLEQLLKELAVQPSIILQSAPGGINSVITGGNPTVNNTVVNPRQSPRHISIDKQAQCSSVLKPHHGVVAIISNQGSEAYQFAKDWYNVFKAAGWEIVEDRVATIMMTLGDPGTGVLLGLQGEPGAPGGFVETINDTPERALFDCMRLLPMPSTDVQAQRWPDMPKGKIDLTVLEQPPLQ